MIVTNHSVFLHNPKTGGTWLKHILDPLIINYVEHHVPDKPFNHVNTFTFVRNPWSWYVSLYLFLRNGSEHYEASKQLKPPIIQALDGDKSFEDFIKCSTVPATAFKNKVFSIYRIFELANLKTQSYDEVQVLSKPEGVILREWLDGNKSYYNVICDVYTRYAHTIGKYETLKPDFIKMLKQSGELNSDLLLRIENTKPINVTTDKDDYRVYYNDTTRQMVAETSRELIERYGYEF
jgi:hypothetical protein